MKSQAQTQNTMKDNFKVAASNQVSEVTAEPAGSSGSTLDVMFIEFFAGSAGLSQAIRKMKIPSWSPQDLATGGYDFRKASTVEVLMEALESLASKGNHLVVHMAPPVFHVLTCQRS